MTSTAVKYITLLRGGMPYVNRVLATGPVALWPLNETSGPVAAEVVNGLNGTYNANVTVGGGTFGDGTPAASFNGTNTLVALPSIESVFNKAEGTLMIWARVSGAGIWTDGLNRCCMSIGTDFNNRTFMARNTPNSQMYGSHRVTGTGRSPIANTTSPLVWFMNTLTWSTTGSATYCYFNTTQSTNAGAPGTWVGSLTTTLSVIGNISTSATGVTEWSGLLRNAAVWNRALTPAEVASLYVSAYAV